MKFEHDLFISYAHIDNQTLGAEQEGWISSFHRSLEVRLAQLRGFESRIWRDPKLQGNDYFADTLIERFPQVGAIVSILSPRYVRSEWCLRELETFCQESEKTGGPRIGDKSRIFKVVKTPVSLDQHPAEIRDVLGYEFYTLDPETGRAREFGQQAGPELAGRYWAKLDDLAHDIAHLLDLLGGEEGAAPAAGAGVIYLAESSYELRDEREALRRDLAQKGFRTLPDRPLPMIAAELETYVGECLEESVASVHLLGESYGIVPEGATDSIVALQYELAARHAERSELERLVWMPPGLATPDDRQRRLLDHVRDDPRAQERVEVVETQLEDFKEILYRRLEPEPEPEEPTTAEADSEGDLEGGLERVYLICDQRDLEHTAELEDFLFDRGLEIILPVFEGEPSQVREDHVENLRLCNGVLIYYGLANELWLRAKLRELQKVGGYGRRQPIRAKAIYVAGPETPQKGRLRTREARVIEAVGGFEPGRLEPFLEELVA